MRRTKEQEALFRLWKALNTIRYMIPPAARCEHNLADQILSETEAHYEAAKSLAAVSL